jgi:hypothetical protein
VYDMYPWDKTAARRAGNGVKDRHSRKRRRAPAPAGPATAGTTGSAVHAVQVALDRRDNGGEAVSASARQ